MKKLNIAVIGAGRLGGFHAEKIIGLPHVELVAVVDPVAANRNRVAVECNTQALAEPAALLGQIDAAVIAAPTQSHYKLAMELPRGGRPSAGGKAARGHLGRGRGAGRGRPAT